MLLGAKANEVRLPPYPHLTHLLLPPLPAGDDERWCEVEGGWRGLPLTNSSGEKGEEEMGREERMASAAASNENGERIMGEKTFSSSSSSSSSSSHIISSAARV